ncbi:MAG: oxidoreductase [Oscillospiraceae bacterium]|nr:oxidoreductase [Oscillospiraceae bacterium]
MKNMGKKGLLFDMEYCTGCFACTVACKQENQFDADTWGIKILEQIYTCPNGHVQVDNVPFPTNLCNLCAERIAKGVDSRPACVKACQCSIIYYGEASALAEKMQELKRPVLWVNNK